MHLKPSSNPFFTCYSAMAPPSPGVPVGAMLMIPLLRSTLALVEHPGRVTAPLLIVPVPFAALVRDLADASSLRAALTHHALATTYRPLKFPSSRLVCMHAFVMSALRLHTHSKRSDLSTACFPAHPCTIITPSRPANAQHPTGRGAAVPHALPMTLRFRPLPPRARLQPRFHHPQHAPTRWWQPSFRYLWLLVRCRLLHFLPC